ncbi:MAG: hypothetical protein L3K11_09020, partial [Thermoplasmata archaeon]|nr:hypothetical protein [Thermoplasmata archaeon]
GVHGAGKTERLLLTAAEARARKAFTVLFDVPEKVPFVVRDLAAAFQKTAGLGGFAQLFSSPKWFRDLAGLQRSKDGKYNAVEAGRAFAAALNANAPAVLLLNDLHNLPPGSEATAFATLLQELSDHAKPGVLVMFGCYPAFLIALTRTRPALTSRINRSLILSGLSVEEAGLLIAKKLLAKRVVEDLEPLYPFEKSAVALLNETAAGNPRRLLELADRVLEYGVSHRTYRIDEEAVRAVMPAATPADRSVTTPAPASLSPPPPPRSGSLGLTPDRVAGTPSGARGPTRPEGA